MPIVLWDYDGVISRPPAGAPNSWADHFETDLGCSLESFEDAIFFDKLAPIIVGQEDLRERVSKWLHHNAIDLTPDEVLKYWFDRDTFLSSFTISLASKLKDRGKIKNYIATNNERWRAAHILTQPSIGQLFTGIFFSGSIGSTKPNKDFFDYIASYLEVEFKDLYFIDDSLENVLAAERIGIKSHCFTPDNELKLVEFINSI